MVYKRGTPEYDRWRKSPEYDLWRERISVAKKGKCRSAVSRARQSAATRGKRHHMYGKHLSEATKQKISASLMGERSPNYGKHLSAKTRAKISVANTGKHRSEETRRKHSEAISGERHHMYGRHLSEEHKQKISAAKKGKPRSEKTKQKISVSLKGRPNLASLGKPCSEETKQKISATLMGRPRPDLRGSNHPGWRGGISFLPYPTGWNNYLRETIRKRDNYICALCRETQNGRQHDVHHINYDKEDLCPENLITLCAICHSKTNYDREYWENLFKTVYVLNFPKERMMRNESSC